MKLNRKGMILLLTVIIVGAVAGAISMTLLASGVDNTIVSGEYDQSTSAKSLADSCAEEALLYIRDNNSFTGTTNVVIGSDQCSYSVVNTGVSNRTIQAESTVHGNTRRVQVIVDQLTPNINVNSWSEVASF